MTWIQSPAVLDGQRDVVERCRESRVGLSQTTNCRVQASIAGWPSLNNPGCEGEKEFNIFINKRCRLSLSYGRKNLSKYIVQGKPSPRLSLFLKGRHIHVMLYFAHLCNARASVGMRRCLQRTEVNCSDIVRNAFYFPWERASLQPQSHQLARWTGPQASGLLQPLPSKLWNDRCLKCGSPCLVF